MRILFKRAMSVTFFTLFFCKTIFADTQIHGGYEYEKPSITDPFTMMPPSINEVFKRSFNKDQIGNWALITASTGVLYYYDRNISNSIKKVGRKLNIGNDDHTKSFIQVGEVSIFRGPTDFGSALYFIGDGWTSFVGGSAFLVAGNIRNDYRALKTASEIYSGLMTTCIFTQVLKRSTGRESPIVSSNERGRWRPFPSFATYQGYVSKYDAFPSGHVATAMMTTTIIANNYQEYKWIRPVGYTLTTMLALQMVNNDVHWASDYPLGIAIGYMIGKTISDQGHKKVGDAIPEKTTYQFAPSFSDEGNMMMALNISY